MTQQEALDKLKALATQLSKVKSEVTKLAEAAQNSGNVSPELEAAINAVTGAVKEIDDLNADEVPETPAEPEV